MAVSIVLATYPAEDRLKLRTLDPACGTGGFLRAALLQIKSVIATQIVKKWSGDRQRAERDTIERLKRICDNNLYGIDKLPELVRAAQMNLAMHGDGSSNIYHANSLLPPGEWPEGEKNNVRSNIKLGSFDVVFTNPPFGSKLPIDDPHILDQFELSRVEAKSPRSSLPPEQLFIERCLAFLKPSGRMAIVLPDSILSNPGLAFIRRWVLRHAYIIASIDLPREMFARSDTHTMTSLLVLQKFTTEEHSLVAELGRPPEYEVFMAVANRVGWDLRGGPVFVRTPEGEEVLKKRPRVVTTRNTRGDVVETIQEVEEPVLDDHLPGIAHLFAAWLTSITPQRWMHHGR